MPPKRKAIDMTSSPLTPLSEEDRSAQQAQHRDYLIAAGIIAEDDVPSSPLVKKAKREKKVASATQESEEVSVTSDIPSDVVAKEDAMQGIITPAISSESDDSPKAAPALLAIIDSAVPVPAKDGASQRPRKATTKKRKADALATETGEQEPPKIPKKATRKPKISATDGNTTPGALKGNGAATPPANRKKAAPKKASTKKCKDHVLPDSVDELSAATAAKFVLPPLTPAVQHKVISLKSYLKREKISHLQRVTDYDKYAIVTEAQILAGLTLLRVHYELSTSPIHPTLDDAAEMIVQRNDDGTFTVDFGRAVASGLDAQNKLAGRGLELEERNLLEAEMEMQAWQERTAMKARVEHGRFRSMEWMCGIADERADEEPSGDTIAESGQVSPERAVMGTVCATPMAAVL